MEKLSKVEQSTVTTIYIRKELLAEFKKLAEADDRTVNWMINDLIKREVRRRKK